MSAARPPRHQVVEVLEDLRIPPRALKLARRLAGMEDPAREQRITLEVIMLKTGEWILIVNNGTDIEHLGR